MSWFNLKILTKPDQADYFTDCFLELGAVSVTYEDAADQPLYEPALGETPLWQQTCVVALFPIEIAVDEILLALIEKEGAAITKQLKFEPLPDENWALAWRAHFKPLRFGHLWICPDQTDVPDPKAPAVFLSPGLAFGTGTHPTTALCLEALSDYSLQNLNILDYGCGSGILALAALKLGASHALCVDHDPQAILATRNNAQQNQFTEAELTTQLAEDFLPQHFDLVIANILAKPLIHLAPLLINSTRPGGQIILSGILASESLEVQKAYSNDILWEKINQREGWVILVGTR